MTDFTKDLTIMVAGSGNVTMPHLEESLADWIFGNVDEREVHVILPLFSQMGGGIRNLIKLGMEWEFKFIVIQAKDSPMTRELSALPPECFLRADDERAALEMGLDILTQHFNGGNETAFVMAHNPKSTYEQGDPSLSDFEIIGDAKNYRWLTTLNLCEGLVDSFEGYETTDEILKRERLQREFEDKQRAEEAAKPKPEVKAPTPRKRAAKKVVAPKPTPAVKEAQAPTEAPFEPRCACDGQTSLQVHTLEDCYDVDESVGTTVTVAGTESTKVGPNPFRDPLPGNPTYDNVLSANATISTPETDVWSEVAAKVKPNHISVSRDDLADLSTSIKELTTAFGNVMDTFTRILKES